MKMSVLFFVGLLLLFLSVARAESLGIDIISVLLGILGTLLLAIPVIICQIIMHNDLTKSQKDGKIKVDNFAINSCKKVN